MTRTTAGLAGVWLLAASCVDHSSRAPVVNSTPSSQSPSASAADQEVLECALIDLATYAGDDSPVMWIGEVLLVAPDTVDWTATVDEVLYRHEEKLWVELSSAEETGLAQAAADLVARTKSGMGTVRFQSEDPHLDVREPEESPQPQYMLLERPIRLWPPGFSADRRLVIVRMSVPWSMHHAEATYVLARRGKGWTIRVRQFVYHV